VSLLLELAMPDTLLKPTSTRALADTANTTPCGAVDSADCVIS
jgi:hypothetical protein